MDPGGCDYFHGGIPAGCHFRMVVHELQAICDDSPDLPGIEFRLSVVFIGLMSYFEAFCKEHFASVLNIEPRLLERLRSNKQDTSIDAVNVLEFSEQIRWRLGSLVAENYDFGSARKINALYRALLNITPFSKDEMRRYDELLHERNLVVHHGGTYTTGYLRQKKTRGSIKEAFWGSVELSRGQLTECIDFLALIAKKVVDSSHRALVKFRDQHGNDLPDQCRDAGIEDIAWWPDDGFFDS